MAPDPTATDRLHALEARLQRLEALEAARELLAAYARACDAQDLPGVVALFAPDCELGIPGQSWTGVDAVREFFRGAWTADPSQKNHFISNVRAVDTRADGADPGEVTVDAYFLYTAAGDDSSVLGWGEYRDVVTTSGPRPLFRSKIMSVTRAADVRQGWALA